MVYRDGGIEASGFVDEFGSRQEALDLGALEEEINYQIRCPQCGTSGPVTNNEPGSVAGWNNLMM